MIVDNPLRDTPPEVEEQLTRTRLISLTDCVDDFDYPTTMSQPPQISTTMDVAAFNTWQDQWKAYAMNTILRANSHAAVGLLFDTAFKSNSAASLWHAEAWPAFVRTKTEDERKDCHALYAEYLKRIREKWVAVTGAERETLTSMRMGKGPGVAQSERPSDLKLRMAPYIELLQANHLTAREPITIFINALPKEGGLHRKVLEFYERKLAEGAAINLDALAEEADKIYRGITELNLANNITSGANIGSTGVGAGNARKQQAEQLAGVVEQLRSDPKGQQKVLQQLGYDVRALQQTGPTATTAEGSHTVRTPYYCTFHRRWSGHTSEECSLNPANRKGAGPPANLNHAHVTHRSIATTAAPNSGDPLASMNDDQIRNLITLLNSRLTTQAPTTLVGATPGASVPNCSHCGRRGHDENTCWKKYPQLAPQRGARPVGRPGGQNSGGGSGGGGVMTSAVTSVVNSTQPVSFTAVPYSYEDEAAEYRASLGLGGSAMVTTTRSAAATPTPHTCDACIGTDNCESTATPVSSTAPPAQPGADSHLTAQHGTVCAFQAPISFTTTTAPTNTPPVGNKPTAAAKPAQHPASVSVEGTNISVTFSIPPTFTPDQIVDLVHRCRATLPQQPTRTASATSTLTPPEHACTPADLQLGGNHTTPAQSTLQLQLSSTATQTDAREVPARTPTPTAAAAHTARKPGLQYFQTGDLRNTVAVEHSGGALSVLHDTMGDTGADVTVMSDEARYALGMEVEPCNESVATSSGVNGKPLGCIKGGLSLVFKPGTPEQLRVTGIKCLVMAGKSLPYNLLIGNDVLTPHNFYVKPREEHMYYSPWLVSSGGRDMREARIPMNIYSARGGRTAAHTAHALHAAAAGGGGVNTTTHPTHCTPETTALHVWHLPPRCLVPPTVSCVTRLASQRRQRVKSWPNKTHVSVTPPDPASTRAPAPPATTPPAAAAAEPSAPPAPADLEVPSAVREASIRDEQARQQRAQQRQEEEELSEAITRSLEGSVAPTVSVEGATSEPLHPHATASTADMPSPVTAAPAAGAVAPAPPTTEAVVGEGSTATPAAPAAPPPVAAAPARNTTDQSAAATHATVRTSTTTALPIDGRPGAPAALSHPVTLLGNVNPAPRVQIPINLIDRGGGPVPTLFPPPPAAQQQNREAVQQALGIATHFHPYSPPPFDPLQLLRAAVWTPMPCSLSTQPAQRWQSGGVYIHAV